jgi:hypothetical protein
LLRARKAVGTNVNSMRRLKALPFSMISVASQIPEKGSADAIQRFTDNNCTCVSYDFDSDYLIEMELHVRHYDLYSATSPNQSSHE